MRWLTILLIFFVIFFAAINVYIKFTGETITGKPLQYVGLNITITPPLAISLISPKNGTYLVNDSIPLNYSTAGGIEKVWYSLDSGNNVTITSPIVFNASEGSHTLYVYANNSFGITVSENVIFSVNSTLFRIIHEEWKGSKKGNSTNFSVLTYEEVQNLSRIILENTGFGKILFNENVNMTADENFNDKEVDLDKNINISFNRIELNTTALPNFNKPATLWIYNLVFTNITILKDGSLCSPTICTQESYSGGVLKFNVTQFGVYTTEETNVTIPPIPPDDGGGGGGGGATPVFKSFTISKTEIKVSLTPGSVLTEKITIKNNLNKNITVNLNKTEGIKDFIALEGDKIELSPLESKEILIDIKVREDTIPDLYAGKIMFSAEGTKEEILVVLEVESIGALLDVEVKILKEYLGVYPGGELLAEIKLLNVGEAGNRKDITIEYIIKNMEGKELMKEGETVSLETQTSWIKRLNIPKDIEIGKHILYVRAITYEGKVASASANFEVINRGEKIIQRILIMIIILIIIISVIIIFLERSRKEDERAKKQNTQSG